MKTKKSNSMKVPKLPPPGIYRLAVVTAPSNWSEMVKKGPLSPEIQAFLRASEAAVENDDAFVSFIKRTRSTKNALPAKRATVGDPAAARRKRCKPKVAKRKR